MDARHLETFHAVVRCGSLLGAARQLQCAQSTITVRIQELERELGAALFARHGRRSVLTEAGQAIFQRSAKIAESITALKDVAAHYAGGGAGRVRLGVIEPTASHRLPAIMTAFYRSRPGLRLTIESGGAERLQRLLSEGELDFNISSPPTLASELRFEPLFEEPIGVLIPRQHPLALRRQITPEDLQRHAVLLTDRGCAYRRSIETALRGISLPDVIEVANPTLIRGMVAAGLGIGLVPMKGGPAPNSIFRQVRGVAIHLPVGIVTRPDHALSPVQNELLTTLRGKLAAGANRQVSNRAAGL